MGVDRRLVLREEAWRSVAWLVLSFLGWSTIVTSTDRVAPTTGAGLAVLTALLLTLVTAAVRLRTGAELRAGTDSVGLLHAIAASAIAGFVLLYVVLARGWSPLLFAGYPAVVGAVVLLWRR